MNILFLHYLRRWTNFSISQLVIDILIRNILSKILSSSLLQRGNDEGYLLDVNWRNIKKISKIVSCLCCCCCSCCCCCWMLPPFDFKDIKIIFAQKKLFANKTGKFFRLSVWEKRWKKGWVAKKVWIASNDGTYLWPPIWTTAEKSNLLRPF